MATDLELLRLYAETRSETAFGELVSRHAGLVYGTALRTTGGDDHLARDVTQTVFTDLARKAGQLSLQFRRRVVAFASNRNANSLTGWLHTSTRFAAAKAIRAESTRRRYEQEAHLMNQIHPSGTQELEWSALRPVLDDAIGHLSDIDRTAVALRFFEGKDLKSVSAALGLNEDAARKRVARALQKLRDILVRSGIRSTPGAIALVLSAHAGFAAPAGLAQTLAATALSLSVGSAMSAPGLSVIGFMVANKTSLLVAFAAVLALTAPLLMQHQQLTNLRQENRRLQQRLAAVGPTERGQPTAPSSLPMAPDQIANRRPAAQLRRPAWQEVESSDYRQYIGNMRQLGIPDETVQDIVLADVNRLYGEKRKIVLADAVIKDEFWKEGGQSRHVGSDQINKLKALGKEKESVIRELIGLETDQRDFTTPHDPKDVAAEIEWRWAFLALEKQSKIKDLTVRFRSQIPDNPNWGGEPMRTLWQQHDENIAQVLSPSELIEHQLRDSALAARLRTTLDSFAPTESEFRSIFQVMRENGRNNPGHEILPEDWDQDRRLLADPNVRARLSTLLNQERLAQLEQKLAEAPPPSR